MKRLISSCAAAAVALGLTMAVSPADAAIDQKAPTTHHVQTLPARTITLTWKQVGTSTRVRLKGKAQDLVNGTIYLQERQSGDWKRIAKTTTDDATRYHFVTKVPKDKHHHKYRVMTTPDDTYAKSYSQIVELYWS